MKLLFALMFAALTVQAEDRATRLRGDERIVFYPSLAQRVPDETNLWRATIRGCVFEPERRGLTVAALRESLELAIDEMTFAESAVFAERARHFLVDHERGKQVFIRLGTNEVFVGKSGADGRFEQTIEFREVLPEHFVAVLAAGDQRQFAGQLIPMENEGVSIISDIDDTIKVTEVRDKGATLRNTFLREFRAVPGMAECYQALAKSNGAAFHYISASPWQLYEPLAAFTASNGFPAGTFELKEFRWKDRSFFNLFGDPEKYKLGVIEPLIKQFPRRRFILVGDSGERDPEIYSVLARKFPGQITHIYMRNVTGEATESARYLEAFREVPRARWQVFREPNEIMIARD